MEKYYISSRSLTESQRMQRALERAGIRSAVVKLPAGLSEGGCGYALSLTRRIEDAVETLKRANIKLNRIYVTSGEGVFREVMY
ncbi:MAG: DUF3343 domain-containing protein [Oscillospiraceae bacterium]|nr:DUF3343 domain-containing protein [Oscillospiraceae bacterium]